MSNFWGPFFHFFGVKKIYSVGTGKLQGKKKKKLGGEGSFFRKKHFLGLKVPLYLHRSREQTTVGYTVESQFKKDFGSDQNLS